MNGLLYRFDIFGMFKDPDKGFELLVDSRSLFNMIKLLKAEALRFTYEPYVET